jgi:hypothetical protein
LDIGSLPPQGLAVYQNGVRINEVLGDTINWDFLPQSAINQMTLVPSNPIYGLNAIGGALSLEMKNGYSYQGAEGNLTTGSYGRISASAQAGGQRGNFSGYITADAINDAGWRQDSPSQLRRVFADLGARGDDNTEFHVTFTGADNHFGAVAATPVQMLAQNWASVFTTPQTTDNQLAFLTASANWKPTDTWTYQAIAYYRYFHQAHVDGVCRVEERGAARHANIAPSSRSFGWGTNRADQSAASGSARTRCHRCTRPARTPTTFGEHECAGGSQPKNVYSDRRHAGAMVRVGLPHCGT